MNTESRVYLTVNEEFRKYCAAESIKSPWEIIADSEDIELMKKLFNLFINLAAYGKFASVISESVKPLNDTLQFVKDNAIRNLSDPRLLNHIFCVVPEKWSA